MKKTKNSGRIKRSPDFRRILITGAYSLTGIHLVSLLKEEIPSSEVFLSDIPSGKKTAPLHSGRILPADARKINDFASLVTRTQPEAILHVAGLNYGDARTLIEVNLLGTLELLSAAATLTPKPVVLLIGSAAQYGLSLDSKNLIKEYDCTRPLNHYGCQEALGLMFLRTDSLDVRFTRTFNLVGPGMNEQSILGKVLAGIRQCRASGLSHTMTVGSLSAYRDFIDVRDAVKLYKSILLHGKAGEVYNVGSGSTHLVRDVVYELIALSKVPLQIQETSFSSRNHASKGGAADMQKTLKLLPGFKPIPFSKSLKDMLHSV